jgi:hypothetical protein
MANVNVENKKEIGATYTGKPEYIKLTYDFSKDGGATADTYRLASVVGKILITEAHYYVETAATSGGSATVTIGAETADADAFMAAAAVASLTANAVDAVAAGQELVVASGDHISLTIATAALTAGKIHLFLTYYGL